MNTKVNVQTILIVFMLCVTVVVSTNTYANAQMREDGQIELDSLAANPIVSGGPGYIMVSPYQFRYKYFAHAEWIFYTDGLFNNSGDTGKHITAVAGVNLPNGATITQLTAYYSDATSEALIVYLHRTPISGIATAMASVASSGLSTSPLSNFTTRIDDSQVDSRQYSYHVSVWIPGGWGADLILTNVRIDYAYTVYTPTIMKGSSTVFRTIY